MTAGADGTTIDGMSDERIQMFTKSSADIVLEDCLQSHTIPEQEGKLQPFTETGLSEKNQLRSLTM